MRQHFGLSHSHEPHTEDLSSYTFSNLEPGKYNLRLIKDSNMNNKWDTGNYLKKINPEKVIYLPKVIDLRANWEINEIFLVN